MVVVWGTVVVLVLGTVEVVVVGLTERPGDSGAGGGDGLGSCMLYRRGGCGVPGVGKEKGCTRLVQVCELLSECHNDSLDGAAGACPDTLGQVWTPVRI